MRDLIHSEHFLIASLLLIALVVGVVTFRDYGESYDEYDIYRYGDYSLKSYKKIMTGQKIQDFDTVSDLNNYGPAHFMLTSLLSSGKQALAPDLTNTQARHFVYFITFLLSVPAMYVLARRWLTVPAALGTGLLFTTQPLLWGHAFINPKDIPFMSFFLVSLTAGLWMCDKIFSSEKIPNKRPALKIFIKHFLQLWGDRWDGKTARIWAIGWGVGIISIWIFGSLFDQALTYFVNFIYSASPHSLLGAWFAMIAPHANTIPVSEYTLKTLTLFHNFKIVLTFLGVLFIAIIIYVFHPHKINFQKMPTLVFVSKGIYALTSQWPIFTAGVLLGFTTSIRVLGPLAGIIVAFYALSKYRWKAILPVTIYAMVAIMIMFVTWPYLWKSPLPRLFETIKMMSSFPWNGPILFNGQQYLAHNAPWYYLPVLFSIQLTEPTLLLFLLGCANLILNIKNHVRLDLIAIVLIWFFVPFIGLVFTHGTVYNNFRQYLFLLPPVFLLCGAALEFVFRALQRNIWRAALLFLIVLPGLYGIFSLHPYEYVYYNSLVGGTGGAYQRFEMDYWLTAYKEAMDFVNTSAPVGATIAVPYGYQVIHARSDLIISNSINPQSKDYDYILLGGITGDNLIGKFTGNKLLLSIGRSGAIFTEVKLSEKHFTP
jgi:hypothetical protein